MHRSLLAAASLSAALLLPAAAGASTVSYDPGTGPVGSTTFQAAPGAVDVTLTSNNRWTDAAQTLTAGAGCTDLGTGTVSCPATSDVVANLRGGDDTFTNTFYWYGLTVHGNGGDDTLSGNGNQTTLYGDGGADHIDVKANARSYAYGGNGPDEIRGGFPQGNGTSLDGGPGADLVVGNSNDDRTITGGDGADQLFNIRAVAAELDGGAGADTIISIGTVRFGYGTITIDGGDGPDTIVGGRGHDVVDAGIGRDTIDVTEATSPDTVTCGAGVDTVYADATDTIAADCENVFYSAAPALPAVDAAKAHLSAAFPDTPQVAP
jgi:Ca2+-binding RTX toxin-like protein